MACIVHCCADSRRQASNFSQVVKAVSERVLGRLM